MNITKTKTTVCVAASGVKSDLISNGDIVKNLQ